MTVNEMPYNVQVPVQDEITALLLGEVFFEVADDNVVELCISEGPLDGTVAELLLRVQREMHLQSRKLDNSCSYRDTLSHIPGRRHRQ